MKMVHVCRVLMMREVDVPDELYNRTTYSGRDECFTRDDPRGVQYPTADAEKADEELAEFVAKHGCRVEMDDVSEVEDESYDWRG